MLAIRAKSGSLTAIKSSVSSVAELMEEFTRLLVVMARMQSLPLRNSSLIKKASRSSTQVYHSQQFGKWPYVPS
jgi:hypothetical protein